MLEILILLFLGYLAYRILRWACMLRYFRGEVFLAHKARVAAFVAEHNEVSAYTQEIRAWVFSR